MATDANKPMGNFCWVELGADKADVSKAFYTSFFGWDVDEIPMEASKTYTMFQKDGMEVGGLYPLDDAQKEQGIPTFWLQYVMVASVDDAVQQAETLGGNVVLAPMDIMDIGRMAVLVDPVGAVFAIWEAKNDKDGALPSGIGTACWHELITMDVQKSQQFYSGLFGWTAHEQMFDGFKYVTFMQGEEPIAGMLALPEEEGDKPQGWMLYFQVENCDREVQAAKELGAKLMMEPADITGVGRFAALLDPQGAPFSIIQLQEM